ncbi:hypothetical protein [Spiroplasma sp. SV19]|uniref:hypothetical protein n=1 Tax=Spiroplasma sp. SV19 TaxID=2570468 RepID=UPI0024B72C8E|nr:hypothetical protein [Spiroplasma sp. SV19]WHQ36766.1 hypothetical protein E7Y35_02520 [Spiroplasma sp. SV19]
MDNDLKFNILESLGLDFSSKDKLIASMKAKKIVGNVELNNIFTNVKNNDFGLEIIIKLLFERINNLEEEIELLKNNHHKIMFHNHLQALLDKIYLYYCYQILTHLNIY